MSKLTHEEVLALSRAVDKGDVDAAKAAMSPGTREVDFTVRVTGAVKIGLPFEQRQAAKADPWSLLAAALSRLNGVTVAALLAEALEPDRIRLGASIKGEAEEAINLIKASTTTSMPGRVTVALDVKVVDDALQTRRAA